MDVFVAVLLFQERDDLGFVKGIKFSFHGGLGNAGGESVAQALDFLAGVAFSTSLTFEM
jgi:hypothetical protein